jgi:hypothetical protein
MMDPNVPTANGEERDAFTGWRRYVSWQHGRLRAVKNSYRRRCRRVAKREIDEALRDHENEGFDEVQAPGG